jgi:hypothetical protein
MTTQLNENNISAINLDFNPSRVCYALGKIGYSPESAICDIVDNSVSATANKILIQLIRKENVADSRKNSLEKFIIIDNGKGMSLEGIKNAFTLGSSRDNYEENTLSKFGLGLKAAGFSQGKRIEIISFTKSDGKNKLVVDLDFIEKDNQYSATQENLNDEDLTLIERHLGTASSGTIIKIDKIHSDNHPSLKTTKSNLKKLLGVTYYYFINDGVEIYLDDELIKGIDILFTNEATKNLEKSIWSGQEVCWTLKQKSLFIDEKSEIKVDIEITQLPHPPSCELSSQGQIKAKDIREKYLIDHKNYGFYVYRNKRLISWAERFDGIITSDQDYYSFRGRIFLDSTADEALNIDVKKSRVLLSEYAYEAISDCVREPKTLSREAWRNRTQHIRSLAGETPEKISEENINKIKLPELLPNDPDDELTLKEFQERKKRQIAKKPAKEEFETGRVRFVDFIEDNTLWDVTYDADIGTIVRINRHHKFIKEINRLCEQAPYGIAAIHTIFYCLAQAEAHTITHNNDCKDEILEKVLLYFRETVSSFLNKATKDSLETL